MRLDGKNLAVGDFVHHFWRGQGCVTTVSNTSATAKFAGSLVTFGQGGKIDGMKLVGVGAPHIIWPEHPESSADIQALIPIIESIRAYRGGK